jgi:hypothetical protein
MTPKSYTMEEIMLKLLVFSYNHHPSRGENNGKIYFSWNPGTS